MDAPPRRRPPPSFRPRFTLMLLYFALFFFAFGLLFALPELLRAASQLAPGAELRPEDIEHAREVTRASLRGRIPLLIVCAAVATGLGIWSNRLPGTR